ncbi:MAG TPA: UDP-N-acetylmuramoyl-L-alanine--D-glutamate ligase [Candidatus Paceibacterota bacterium]
MNYKSFFKDKKITLMGLGILGRGVGDAVFLAECGANLIVTDLKKEDDLKESLSKLKNFKNITFILGEHRLEDFRNRDFILKGPNVPINSPHIAEARKNGIPIKMSASWFAEIAQIPFVGITGTRGKSTTTEILHKIMKEANMKVLLGGNVQGVSTLALLSEVSSDSIILMELDSWQLAGFGERKISPQLGVFTTFFPDHLNYYGSMGAYLKDKAQIFLHQKSEDTLVVSTQVMPVLKETYGKKIISRVVIADPVKFPKQWSMQVPGEHNKLNAECAIEAARALGIDDRVIQKVVENFKGIPGRLEFLREIGGVRIYNDTTATTPEATIAALRALDSEEKKNIVLMVGGFDKGLDPRELWAEIPKHCKDKKIILLKMSGPDAESIDHHFHYHLNSTDSHGKLSDAVTEAMKVAEKGDIVLFSPAFASFGPPPGGFKNEYDRGEQFNVLVQQL